MRSEIIYQSHVAVVVGYLAHIGAEITRITPGVEFAQPNLVLVSSRGGFRNSLDPTCLKCATRDGEACHFFAKWHIANDPILREELRQR